MQRSAEESIDAWTAHWIAGPTSQKLRIILSTRSQIGDAAASKEEKALLLSERFALCRKKDGKCLQAEGSWKVKEIGKERRILEGLADATEERKEQVRMGGRVGA